MSAPIIGFPLTLHTGERRKESAIGCSKRRPWLLPTKHHPLMPQNEQLDVLGESPAPAFDKQAPHR